MGIGTLRRYGVHVKQAEPTPEVAESFESIVPTETAEVKAAVEAVEAKAADEAPAKGKKSKSE